MMQTLTKHTPLFTSAQRLNAQFIGQAGWQVISTFGDVEDELLAVRERVAIADCSVNGKITVEGEQVERFLKQTLGVELEIGQGLDLTDYRVFRLRHDIYFVSTPPGNEAALAQKLTETATDDLITITDLTHGRAELRLVGPQSAELLSRLCGLDFHPTIFPNLTAKQSSVAKTTQLIIRRDLNGLPAYSLIGAASLGAYLWDIILEAGRDLNLMPVGHTALEGI